MSDLCTIKANSHGINLLLDADADFEELITDICRKFANNRDFFGAADIILEVTGRERWVTSSLMEMVNSFFGASLQRFSNTAWMSPG